MKILYKYYQLFCSAFSLKWKLTAAVLRLSIVLLAFICYQQSVFGSDEQSENKTEYGDIGRELSNSEITQLRSQIFSDGQGLPNGSGNVEEGAQLYQLHCSDCHGSRGEGASAVELVGDRELLATAYPDKGIAVYWPFAPTLFSYIQRAMPPDKPNSFSDSELYSIVAYVLFLNELIARDATLDQTSLAGIELPNRNGFTNVYP